MPSRRVAPENRKRTEFSCDRCKNRKQKCAKLPGQQTCRYCDTHGFECATTHPRRTRLHASVEGLGIRIGLLESLVKGLVPEADTSSIDGMRALGMSLGIPLPPPPPPPSVGGAAFPGHLGPLGGQHGPGGVRSGSFGGHDGLDADGRPLTAESRAPSPIDDEMMVPVLRDQQGQAQYIGPASSYLFQIRIRTLFGAGPQRNPHQAQFFLFGPNPAAERTPSTCSPTTMTSGETSTRGHSPVSIITPASSEPTTSPGCSGSSGGHGSEREEASPGGSSVVASLFNTPLADALITAFFDHVHCDFPVLDEASFRQEYELYSKQSSYAASRGHGHGQPTDATWTCIFLCALILARRTPGASGLLSDAEGQYCEERWWRHAQSLLTSVLFTSNLAAVQALLLAGLYLQSTNHRDACWTLTGSAARIAFAIGLHREPLTGDGHGHGSTSSLYTPAMRELRRRVWWTLFGFEIWQASSLDRPSAIDDSLCSTSLPRDCVAVGVADMGANGSGGAVVGDDDVWAASVKLVPLLSQACRVVRSMASHASSIEDYGTSIGPLSPAASLLRDLTRWREALGPHLRPEAVDSLPQKMQRAVLLMHLQYCYVLGVLSRNSLLAHAAALCKSEASVEDAHHLGHHQRQRHHSLSALSPTAMPSGAAQLPPPHNAPVLPEICIEAAQKTCQLVLRLRRAGCFDPTSWLDVFYLYTAAMALVLGVFYEVKRHGGSRNFRRAERQSPWLAETRRLLQACAEIADEQVRDPSVPGTSHRYCLSILELNAMVSDFIRRSEEETGSRGVEEDENLADVAEEGDEAESCISPTEQGATPARSSITVAVPPPPVIAAPRSKAQHQQQQQQQQCSFPAAMGGGAADYEPIGMFPRSSMRDEYVPLKDDAPAFQGAGAGVVVSSGPMSNTTSAFGFSDTSWMWQDGHWSDLGNLMLGSEYGA